MSPKSPITGRPNVLLVLSDEQNWDTLGCNGNAAARTPHLDALAAEGTVLDRFYTPFPLCCPSRTTMLTAMMPRHHHVLGNWRGINPDLRGTGLGRSFADAGYHTIYVGKWHVPGTTPREMYFRDSAAVPAVINGKDRGRYIEGYRDHLESHGYRPIRDHIGLLTKSEIATLQDPSAPHRGRTEVALEHYLETWQTEQLLQRLEARPNGQPWLAVCSFNAPHFPMLVPAPYDRLIDRQLVRLPESFALGATTLPSEVARSHFADRFADLDESDWIDVIAHYYGMCAMVDSCIGKIIGYLKSTGQWENCIVAFTSDHGDMMGAHRLVEKGHLLHYEETLRIPLIIRHPDGSPARHEHLLSMTDLAPTLAESAGVPFNGAIDGRSFADLISGPAAGGATREYVTSESVLWEMDSENAFGEHRHPDGLDLSRDAVNLSIRTQQHHYIFRSRDVDELYDMSIDAGQTNNVVEQCPTVRRRLRHALADQIGDVFPEVATILRGSRHDGDAASGYDAGLRGRSSPTSVE